MTSTSKPLTQTLTILLLSSLLTLSVTLTNIQAVSKLSVPQFSVKFIDKSYDVSPIQTKDPYTGKTVIEPGYHVNDGWLEVTIKNQPFKPYTVGGYQQRDLYYTVEVKGRFGGDTDWRAIAHTDSVYQRDISYIEQSGSKHTVLTDYTARYDSGVQLDFRVKAVIGYLQMIPPFLEMIIEESGDWSSIQTITINHGTSSLSPSQTATFPVNPTIVPEGNQSLPHQLHLPKFVHHPVFLLGISVLFVGLVVTVVMVFLRRHLKNPTYYSNNYP